MAFEKFEGQWNEVELLECRDLFCGERPFAVKARDHDLTLKHQTTDNFPGRGCFSERSEWLDEFIFDQRLAFLTPTHYTFNLIDNFIEIIGDSSPTVEEIANEVSVDES